MAHSPGPADRRAHLIREMARSSERSHSRGSAASSAGSARDQPLHYDTATQELPVPSEHDFHINSSALRRAFPDFSQYGSSEDDSIEVGRGLKGSLKGTSGRSLRSADVSENLSFSFGAGSRYEITATPPLKPRDKIAKLGSVKSSMRMSSMKENMDPNNKMANFTASGVVNNNNQDGRKVLGDMHARVESDDTGSLSDKRPALITTSVRNTRFDRRGRKNSNSAYAISEATGTVDVDSSTRPATRLEEAIQNGTVTGTHQSFLLPDLPNITELVSGVRQDGTPLFTRSAKSASRFATPSQRRKSSALKPAHIPISTVPIPVDEKALYVSLQLLQDKVAALETDKAKAEEKLEEYELENLQLKSKLEEHAHRHSDSGMGTDIEEGKRRDWEGQKSQLESSIRSLQDRLDRANRKLATSEVTIAALNDDRAAAHQQLAVAYLNSEELKDESEAMQKEMAGVNNEFAKLTKKHEARIAQLMSAEAELRGKIERREKAVKEMGSLAKELWSTRNALAASGRTVHALNLQNDNTIETQHTGVIAETTKPLEPTSATANAVRVDSRVTNDKAQPLNPVRSRSTSRRRPQPSRNEQNNDATTDLQFEPVPRPAAELTIDSTYISFMDGDEVAKLRHIVEEDKALLAQTNPQQAAGEELQPSMDDEPTHRSIRSNAMPRKSSMKSVSYKVNEETKQSIRAHLNSGHIREAATYDDEPMDADEPTHTSAFAERQDTHQSIASQRSQRRARVDGPAMAEMTSAFILPDITLDGVNAIIPSSASQAIQGTKQTTIITRPVPVSERMPVPAPGEEDATIRPGQSPGLALATVLRGLEAELQRLREQLAEQEILYNQHDPSLSKRQRKIVYARVQKLLAVMETRADQIYALYDVLEGQKEKGQMMQEEEVEVTLHNIGIDTAAARRASIHTVKMNEAAEADSEADFEDDEELPWEGIEPTQTQTLPSVSGFRARR